MNHTTVGTIFAISMVAALMIVGASIITSTQAQAALRLPGGYTLDTSNGATLQGPHDLCISTIGQPPASQSQSQASDAAAVQNPCSAATSGK
jgi:hypothetical protein